MLIESRQFPLLIEFRNSTGVPVTSTLTKYSCPYACNKGISGGIAPLILHVATTRKSAVSSKPRPQYCDRFDTVCLCSFPTFLVFSIAPGRLLPKLSSMFLKYLLLLFSTSFICSVFSQLFLRFVSHPTVFCHSSTFPALHLTSRRHNKP